MLSFEWMRCDKSSSLFTHGSNQFPVDLVYLIILQTIPIRGIGYHDSFGFCGNNEVTNREYDIIKHSGSFRIATRDTDHLRINVNCGHAILATWVDSTSSDILDLGIDSSIKKLEFFYTKIASQSWRNIASNHHRLNSDSSRPTERITEWRRILPVGKCDHRCGKILLDRCFSGFSSVSSLVQWISRDIEENMCHIIDNQYEDMYLDAIRKIWGIESREDGTLTHTLDRWNTLQG